MALTPFQQLQDWITESEDHTRSRRDRSVVDLMYEGFRLVSGAYLQLGEDALVANFHPIDSLVTDGTVITGGVTDVSEIDGTYYQIEEAAGVPGYDITFYFTGLTSFHQLSFYGRYEGGSSISHPTSDAIIDGDGTVISGDVTELAEINGTYYQIEEVSGVPGYHIVFYFTGLMPFNQLMFYGRYEGNPAHDITIAIYDWVNTAYVDVGYLDSRSTDIMYTFGAPSDQFLKDGKAQVRFYHSSSGNTSHDLYIDYMALTGKDETDIAVEMYDWVNSTYVDLGHLGSRYTDVMHTYSAPSAQFLQGDKAQVKFSHAEFGDTSHDLYIDYLALTGTGIATTNILADGALASGVATIYGTSDYLYAVADLEAASAVLSGTVVRVVNADGDLETAYAVLDGTDNVQMAGVAHVGPITATAYLKSLQADWPATVGTVVRDVSASGALVADDAMTGTAWVGGNADLQSAAAALSGTASVA